MSDMPTPPDVGSSSGSSGPAPGPAFIEAANLHKAYTIGPRTLEVLRGVDLRMERGAFLALRGASGAGKSTLLHLLGGLDVPNQGRILLAGMELTRLSSAALSEFRNRKVGFIFQSYHLMPELDALENVSLPGRIARRPAREVEAQARELLRRVGLGERLEHKAFELSGGEQQRVALARALINDPELVLADEPTGNLDSHTGEEIIELLCELSVEKKTTLIIATHDPKVAARAPRIMDLVDGLIA